MHTKAHIRGPDINRRARFRDASRGVCRASGFGCVVLALALLAACRSLPPVDWAARMGSWSFDDAVKEYGAPDKSATLADGARVCEWRLRKGYSSAYVTGYPTQPYTRVEVPPAADEWLRLTFGSDGKLSELKRYWR